MVMNKYGLATILEDRPVGYEFYEDNIPLHLTHIDSFRMELEPVELNNKLRQLFIGQKAISTAIKGFANYGPDKNIPVAELTLTSELDHFHYNLVSFLEHEGAIFKRPHFLNRGFKPHVTEIPSIKLFEGEIVTIRSISIATVGTIDIRPKTKIFSTINF